MPHPIKPPSATTATALPPATASHPHPDFHAEALALVGGNLPLAVRVSHALAEAKLGGLREALSVCLPGTVTMPDARREIQRRIGVVRGHGENAGEHVAQPFGDVGGGKAG
jgi:hypothetical protein